MSETPFTLAARESVAGQGRVVVLALTLGWQQERTSLAMMVDMSIVVAVSLAGFRVRTAASCGLAAREPRHGAQEQFGVVVVGGADFVRRGLDGPIFQDLDHELVDFHAVTPSVAPRLACGPPR